MRRSYSGTKTFEARRASKGMQPAARKAVRDASGISQREGNRIVVKLFNKLIFAVGIFGLAAFATGQTKWRLPVTIETLQDVQVHATETGAQKRGVLYVGGEKSFTIKKGQRFLMVRVYADGECRIQFEGAEYDVSSCPWLDGFSDHQEDVFKVATDESER